MRLIIMQGTGGLASRASMAAASITNDGATVSALIPSSEPTALGRVISATQTRTGRSARTPRTATLPKRPKTMPQRSGLGSGPICLRRIARSHSASSQPNGSTRR